MKQHALAAAMFVLFVIVWNYMLWIIGLAAR